MSKSLKIALWILLLVVVLLIPALYGGLIAVIGAGTSCTSAAAWIAWLKICVAGSYVLLTLNGLGILALLVIAWIVKNLVALFKS
jgi:hypothetical protein